jgi:hypothetical protein
MQAPGTPAETRRECHVRAIRTAYDGEMSKMTGVPQRRDR